MANIEKIEVCDVETDGKKLSVTVRRAYSYAGTRKTYLNDEEVQILKSLGSKTMLTCGFDGERYMSEQIIIEVSSYDDALLKFNQIFKRERSKICKVSRPIDYFGTPYSRAAKIDGFSFNK